MIEMEQIIQYITIYAPILIAIGSFVAMLTKVLKEFASLKKECLDMKNVKEVNDKLKLVMQENAKLKKDLDKCLTLLTHVDQEGNNIEIQGNQTL